MVSADSNPAAVKRTKMDISPTKDGSTLQVELRRHKSAAESFGITWWRNSCRTRWWASHEVGTPSVASIASGLTHCSWISVLRSTLAEQTVGQE